MVLPACECSSLDRGLSCERQSRLRTKIKSLFRGRCCLETRVQSAARPASGLMTATRKQRPVAWLVAPAVIMLVSCAMGPDFKRPEAPGIDRYTDAEFPNAT